MRSSIRNQSLLLLSSSLAAIAGVGIGAATGLTWLLIGGIGAAIVAASVGWRLVTLAQSLQVSLAKGERMRLLGQVSGGLAHQIRNGVAGAKLAVQLHARSCSDGNGESLDAARRQLARVESDLSRYLDLGRDDVPRRPCHVVELVEEAAALVRPQCRHADVQLCWEPPIIDPVVSGNSGRLGHVVVNLLTNAVEAANPGGQVEITVDQPGDGVCVVEVWDSGPGLDPFVAGRLFQPFVTGKADGVGLGLFVARRAAEAHGGRLDWRREHGRTCFRVELPAAEGKEAEDRAPAAVRG